MWSDMHTYNLWNNIRTKKVGGRVGTAIWSEHWAVTHLYLLPGAVKSNNILSQNWFPGKLSIAMKAKYPQRTEEGILFKIGIAATHAPTIKAWRRLLRRCSLTSTGKSSSISLSTSKTVSSTGASMYPELDARWTVVSFSSFNPCLKEHCNNKHFNVP